MGYVCVHSSMLWQLSLPVYGPFGIHMDASSSSPYAVTKRSNLSSTWEAAHSDSAARCYGLPGCRDISVESKCTCQFWYVRQA